MAYTTLADVKKHLEISDTSKDDILNLLIPQAEQFVKSYTGRVFGGNQAITSEVHDYKSIIYSRYMDVVSIQSVKIGPSGDQTTLGTDDYTWNKRGRFVLSHLPQLQRTTDYDTVELNYTVNGGDVPADLKWATEHIIVKMFQNRKGQGEITEEKTGQYAVKYQNLAQDAMTEVHKNPDMLGILNGYRRRRISGIGR